MKKKIIGTLFFLPAIAFLNIQALACSCGPTQTVLDAFEKAGIVVTTRLSAVEKVREKKGEYDVGHIRSVTMIVNNVYKGDVKSGRALKVIQGGGSVCMWAFDEEIAGQEYLLYVGAPIQGPPYIQKESKTKDEGMFYISACGRSTSAHGAADDLSYLDNFENVRGKTRLSGRLLSLNTALPTGTVVKLKIIGKNNTYQIQMDKNGFYEIYDLPPGDYNVVPEIPFGWKIDEYMLGRQPTGVERSTLRLRKEKNHIPVRITSERHTGLDLIFDIDRAP
ncbi:MAG: hypothetical protein WKF92_15940 [Pyrinomonadaceae bacterium]